MNMQSYEVRRIGQNKGAPRIWLEGSQPARAGFNPGSRYSVSVDSEKTLLTLEVVPDGVRVVSSKRKGEKEIPVIDINSKELLSIFDGIESVRVVVQGSRIFILPVASEIRAKQRLARIKEKLEKGNALEVGSLSSGIGILDLASHEGMSRAGVKTHLAFANEIRDDCMQHAIERNPCYTDRTITITAPMQEVAFDMWAMNQLPEIDGLIAGIPCSGASVAGRSKRGLEHAEAHPEVGHLVVAFLAVIAKVNPAWIVLENVIPYRSSASMSIIRNQLRDLGYDVHETELNAADWNMLEHRKRMCMVAVTKGMQFSFDELGKPAPEQHTFGEIMDQVDPSHSTWGDISYLWAKQERDEAAGKGFAPTVVDANSTRVPTLNKTLHKRQSTGTFIQHPEKKNLYRIPTVAEHARCKGIDERLVVGTTQTFGHEACGQAICVPPFVSAFQLLGESLLQLRNTSTSNIVHFARPEMKAAA